MDIAKIDTGALMAKSVTITWTGNKIGIHQTGDVTAMEMIEILGGAIASAAKQVRAANAKPEKKHIIPAAALPMGRG